MKTFIQNHKLVAGVVLIVILAIIGYFAYEHFHPPKTVTVETTQEATTSEGVEKAADYAKVEISSDQAQTAAQGIKEASTQSPSYVVETTASEAVTAEKAAQESSGADFSIVTDKNSTTTTTDTTKLAADTPVELNQYNIQAYKKTLQTVTTTNQSVTYTVSQKISKNGHYIGVTTGYNYKDHDAIAGLSYTW